MPKTKKDLELKPWKDICCSRCFVAKSEKKKCKCHCKGNHHGETYKKKGDKSKTEPRYDGDIWLSEEDRKKHEEWMQKQKKPQ